MKSQRPHWLLRLRPAFLASWLKRILRIKRRVVTTTHGRFFIDPASQFGGNVMSSEGYEPEMVQTVTRLLREGGVFVDVGANEGFFSVLASSIVGDRGRVWAIEPQSRLQPVIFRNMLENHVRNMTVSQLAISDNVGMATLFLLPDMNIGGSGLFKAPRYSVATETIPQTTLSRFLGSLKIDSVDLLKMDIEGFEYEAILGSREVFENGMIRHIALETHPALLERRGKPERDILQFLERAGYQRNESCPTMVYSKAL